jgi:hypothetical protein
LDIDWSGLMAAIEISIINASDAVSDDQCRALTDALQIQVSRDFAPVWRIDPKLTFVQKGRQPASGTWWLSILDNTDRAGVLGHHDLTPDGLPMGKSFAGTDIRYGYEWTVTASHELLEMLVNPGVNLTVLVHTQNGDSKLYAYEVCDPCEDQTFRTAASTQFDHQGKLTAPVPAILPAGYISAYDLNGINGWQQLTAATGHTGKQPRASAPERVSSRRERRQRPKTQWVHSTAFR